MIRNFVLALPMSALLFACNQGQEEKLLLQAEVDSLHMELQQSQKVAFTLQEITSLMDSIDAVRNNFAFNLENGPNENYVARMKELHEYVQTSKFRLAELEKALQTSKSVGQTYASTIKKYKQEIIAKDNELAMLQQKVEGLQTDIFQLASTVESQNKTISLKTTEIMSQSEELARTEAKIQEMLSQQRISEADAYFARGEAVEEIARRTQLARKKKQASYKEALQLYEKSYALGRTDAKPKMDLLTGKIR